MRIGKVIGTVTLNRSHPSLARRVVSAGRAAVAGRTCRATTRNIGRAESCRVRRTRRGPGSRIAISEGGEAAQPFRPNDKPVDAYNAAILDTIDMNPLPTSWEMATLNIEEYHEIMNLHKLKQEICDIGRRIYTKASPPATTATSAIRISENEVLCTPTMISKGFMKPDDLCIVDMQGNQLSGRRKRTSEMLLHLAIMKERPDVKSVVHCHPPHATAFAVAREPIPQCVLPEVEVFLGDVPITKYETPGGQAFADTVLPFVKKSNVIILANHGTVSFGERSSGPTGGPKFSTPIAAS